MFVIDSINVAYGVEGAAVSDEPSAAGAHPIRDGIRKQVQADHQ